MPHDVTGCPGATSKQTHAGAGFLPGDLAAAYSYDGLISGTNDGSGQTIGFVEFSDYNRNDALSFRNCFTGIAGHFPNDVSIGGGPSDHFGQVEVNLDLEVAMGAAPDASVEGLQGGQQPGAPADDAQQDASGRREHRVGQLGPVRALRADQAHGEREHGARAARGARHVVLRGVGRRRRGGLPLRQPERQVPRDRRPVGPAVRDGRRRNEPARPTTREPRREGVEGLGRRHLDQLAQAGLPAGWHCGCPRRAGRVLLERLGPLPRDAGHRHGRRTTDGLHHPESRAGRRRDAGLGHRRRNERCSPARRRDYGRCERVCGSEPGLREPVHLRDARPGRFQRHHPGQQLQRHRRQLPGQPRIRSS